MASQWERFVMPADTTTKTTRQSGGKFPDRLGRDWRNLSMVEKVNLEAGTGLGKESVLPCKRWVP